MYKNTELRKLPAGSLLRITETLETNDDWKKVMCKIPKQLDSEKFEPKYSDLEMRAIAEYAKHSNRYCAEILLDEWATSGRVRPTLGTLQKIVLKAGILKAADEIALMLQEPPVSRPELGPGAKINTSISEILNESEARKRTTKSKKDKTESTAQMKSDDIPSFFRRLRTKSIGNKTTQQVQSDEGEHCGVYNGDSSYSNEGLPNIPSISRLIRSIPYPRQLVKIDTTILQNKTLVAFDYKELEDITCGFSEDFIHGPTGPTGKIGDGGFGEVYAGWHQKYGTLAVKKFRKYTGTDKPNYVAKSFNAEVKSLAQLRHENIVPIIGYSIHESMDKFPSLCIVCAYIDGGSLDTNLAAKRLSERQRLDIMVGTACGLEYIHKMDPDRKSPDSEESDKRTYIHGDVKTANILLTRDYKPKLCDFGLTKSFDTTKYTQSLMGGTQPYMSIERLQGTLTPKSDIYSFGVVLLELLTGLPCVIKNRNGGVMTIQHHIAEKTSNVNFDVSELFDEVIKPWSKGNEVYQLALKCLIDNYSNRYSIDQVCKELAEITAQFENDNVEEINNVKESNNVEETNNVAEVVGHED